MPWAYEQFVVSGWNKVISSQRPSVNDRGYEKTSDGQGPRIRNVREVPEGTEMDELK